MSTYTILSGFSPLFFVHFCMPIVMLDIFFQACRLISVYVIWWLSLVLLLRSIPVCDESLLIIHITKIKWWLQSWNIVEKHCDILEFAHQSMGREKNVYVALKVHSNTRSFFLSASQTVASSYTRTCKDINYFLQEIELMHRIPMITNCSKFSGNHSVTGCNAICLSSAFY